VVSMQTLKRPEEATDLVGAALFLASSDSDFMTGQIVNVDGGVFFN
jgi:NAD(P)-dependent dehydrogenase (short-subunit alcohol dehydrogenase family)